MYKLLYRLLIIIILLTTLSGLVHVLISCKEPDPVVKWNINSFDLGKMAIFTKTNLKKELASLDIEHSDIVYNQAVLETGHFKSSMFIKKNNLFGFRNLLGYMSFDTWQDCCKYYAKWQKKHYKGGDYYVFLKKIGYAEDSTYIKKLKTM